MAESKLNNGLLPANKECPFKDVCDTAARNKCNHLGKKHNIEFSCSTARGFDLTWKRSVSNHV